MKRLFKIVVSNIGRGGVLKYIFLGLLSGMSSFLFINTVSRVIGLIITGKYTTISKEYILIFASIILLFIWVRRTLALIIINLSQRIGWNLRKEILLLALGSNYQQLSARKAKIHAAILNDVGALTNASMSIIDFFISLIMVISCFIYLASISIILFLITLVVAMIGVTVYLLTTNANLQGFEKGRILENKFQEYFNAILNGFKEIYMEPKKGKFIFDKKISVIANDSYKNNTTALTGFLNNSITGQILFYILISSVLLFFSTTLNIKSGDTVGFVFTLIYLLGSIESIMVMFPTFLRAGIASNHLMDLKKELEEVNSAEPSRESGELVKAFEKITVENLEFYYGRQDSSFGVGPVSLTINKGDIVFIYGGNGSGKTTFVNAVIGLCTPSAGRIKLNDICVHKDTYAAYRTLFSAVFSDYYLFNEIIGVEHFDLTKWDYYLRLFELEDKVSMQGKCFYTTDLSTGQKKRLALIIALMEEKPILVIDEWAADQDPYFRRKFYTEIIPMLKKSGLTILAITHDDKYYYCADKLFKMDEGKILEENIDFYQSSMVQL